MSGTTRIWRSRGEIAPHNQSGAKFPAHRHTFVDNNNQGPLFTTPRSRFCHPYSRTAREYSELILKKIRVQAVCITATMENQIRQEVMKVNLTHEILDNYLCIGVGTSHITDIYFFSYTVWGQAVSGAEPGS